MARRIALLTCWLGFVAAGPAGAEDQPASPPLAAFPREFGLNFGRLFARPNVFPALFGAAATATAHLADDDVHEYFSEERRFPGLGDGGQAAGQGLVAGAVSAGLLVAAYSGENQHFRRFAFSLGQGIAVSQLVTAAIKFPTERTRPDGSDQLSFPSGHVATAFTWATVVGRHYGKSWGAASYGVAGLMAVSRLEKDKHWLSDVVAGGFIGTIIGNTVSRGTDSWAGRHDLAVVPVRGRPGTGVALALRF